MRPACHFDTQNTAFWQFGHPKFYVRICWWWLFLEDRRCRGCSVTFTRHTKQYLAQKSKICKWIGFILLVVHTLYHTLDTQKSMKPLFGHPVSKYRLRPWRDSTVLNILHEEYSLSLSLSSLSLSLISSLSLSLSLSSLFLSLSLSSLSSLSLSSLSLSLSLSLYSLSLSLIYIYIYNIYIYIYILRQVLFVYHLFR